jgi:hypothetical protein
MSFDLAPSKIQKHILQWFRESRVSDAPLSKDKDLLVSHMSSPRCSHIYPIERETFVRYKYVFAIAVHTIPSHQAFCTFFPKQEHQWLMFSALILPAMSMQGCACPSFCEKPIIEAQGTVMLATCTLFILLLSQHIMICSAYIAFIIRSYVLWLSNTRLAPAFKWALPTWHVLRRHFFQKEKESDMDRT